MSEQKLSFEEYPSIYPMPDEGFAQMTISNTGVSSARMKSSKYSKAKGASSNGKKGGSRQIVFMAGGLCFSELRAVEELMDAGGPEIIIGGTSFITPGSFVKDIASI